MDNRDTDVELVQIHGLVTNDVGNDREQLLQPTSNEQKVSLQIPSNSPSFETYSLFCSLSPTHPRPQQAKKATNHCCEPLVVLLSVTFCYFQDYSESTKNTTRVGEEGDDNVDRAEHAAPKGSCKVVILCPNSQL